MLGPFLDNKVTITTGSRSQSNGTNKVYVIPSWLFMGCEELSRMTS